MRQRRPRKAKKIEPAGSDSEHQEDGEFEASESAASEFESAPRKRKRLRGASQQPTRKVTSGKGRKKDATSKQMQMTDEGDPLKNAVLQEASPVSDEEVWTEVAIDHCVPLEDSLPSSDNEEGFEISLER